MVIGSEEGVMAAGDVSVTLTVCVHLGGEDGDTYVA